MKLMATVLLSISLLATAGENLLYHGSVPAWVSSGGTYRGTWFHVQDFIPGATGFTVEWVEIWLIGLDAMQPGDGLPVLEIWNEDLTVLLGESEVTGFEVWFSPAVDTGEDFWCILNTEMCTETISILTDGDPDGHSIYSDDGMAWEEHDTGEYFMAACCTDAALSCSSWGELKTLF